MCLSSLCKPIMLCLLMQAWVVGGAIATSDVKCGLQVVSFSPVGTMLRSLWLYRSIAVHFMRRFYSGGPSVSAVSGSMFGPYSSWRISFTTSPPRRTIVKPSEGSLPSSLPFSFLRLFWHAHVTVSVLDVEWTLEFVVATPAAFSYLRAIA